MCFMLQQASDFSAKLQKLGNKAVTQKEANGNFSPVYESKYIIETAASSIEPMLFMRCSSKVLLDVCTFGIT